LIITVILISFNKLGIYKYNKIDSQLILNLEIILPLHLLITLNYKRPIQIGYPILIKRKLPINCEVLKNVINLNQYKYFQMIKAKSSVQPKTVNLTVRESVHKFRLMKKISKKDIKGRDEITREIVKKDNFTMT